MKIQVMKINWKNWRRKTWEFVKRFPAVTYGVVGILTLTANTLCTKCVESFGLVLMPLVPAMLTYAGFFNLISSVTNSAVLYLIVFVFSFTIFFLLDLISIPIQKFFTKCLGENFFSKIIAIAVILFLWFCVFTSLLESLPIDV